MAYNPTPIGVGRGKAQVFGAPTPRKYVDEQGNAQRAANKAQADAQSSALDKILDVDFDKGWQKHDNQIQEEIDNYRNKIVGWSKQGGDMTDPDFQRVVKAEQDRIGLTARKSNNVKEVFKEVRTSVGNDTRYNKEDAYRKINSVVYNEDGTTKNLWDVDDSQFSDAIDDPSIYNMQEVYKGIYDNIPSLTDSFYRKWNPNDDEDVTRTKKTSFKGKFFKTTPKGNYVIDTETDMGREFLMQDEFMNNYINQQIADGKTVDEAFRGFKEYAERGIGTVIQNDKIKKTKAGGKGTLTFSSDGQKVMRIDNEYNPDDPSNPRSQEGIVYNEIIPGGDKDAKTFYIKPSSYKNVETGEIKQGKAGDFKFQLTSIQAIPWFKGDAATLDKKELGLRRYGKEQDLIKDQLSNDDAGVKYISTGLLWINGEDKEPIQVQIPYEDGSDQFEQRAGISISDRPLKELSNPELIDVVKSTSTRKLKPKEITDAIDVARENDLNRDELEELIKNL